MPKPHCIYSLVLECIRLKTTHPHSIFSLVQLFISSCVWNWWDDWQIK